MQVQRVSSFSVPNTQKKQSSSPNYASKLITANGDKVSFGHNLMFPDTQTVVRNLISRLSRFNRAAS